MPSATEFNAIRISLASPEQVRQWSYGEVTKPETINYRTLRPERDGLFCERIFGPTKDWECACGKYKKIRYRGVTCDRCGVEVTRAKVRRERMGHITLAAPVAHIWLTKGIPSRLGLLLDLSPRNLDRVLYFAQYIITAVDPLMRTRTVEVLRAAYETDLIALEEQCTRETAELRATLEAEGKPADLVEGELARLAERFQGLRAEFDETLQAKIDDVESLRPLQLLTETRYRELNDRFGDVFRANMGAEAILEILRSTNLDDLASDLENEVRTTSGQRRKKAVKRLRVVDAFRRGNNKPEWMILTVLPVLPPDLRPMVQLDGGRFATSDLNDLYRRVINRNNRLRRLLDLGAPGIIIRNEKGMLQEAVDDLIDNGRRGRAIVGSHNHRLKSLSDLLRGKQGRFRQNLLGKRVDYGGRSVIVVGPRLALHECGLPKRMALELFKPFVMNRLVLQGLAHNIKSAKRMVERARPEVWDILEEVIRGRPVLLNRAPTLHRLGIQAFMPVLVEGSAIQLHPLVCTAFNADFDGDQMAVHVPLSREAVLEAKRAMLSTYNMLSPASGEPMVAPTYEIVLGCYYLTNAREGARGEGSRYRDLDDVMMAYNAGLLELHSLVQVRQPGNVSRWMEVTPGRIIFNAVLPEEVRRYDLLVDKKALKDIVTHLCRITNSEQTAAVLDQIKDMGFRYATASGTTIGIADIQVPPEKGALLADAERQVEVLEEQYEQGLITQQEQHNRTIAVWQRVSTDMDKIIAEHLPEYGGIYLMAHSGARGNEAQIKQMAGMRGLMSNPRGDIIDLPIRSSFREGLTVLEYFISTHGARKGLADTALRTADSGYLTRRLIDVAQEVIILEDDCGTERGTWIHADASEEDLMIDRLANRLVGRTTTLAVAHPDTGELLVDAGQEVDEAGARRIEESGVKHVSVRSPLTCGAKRGICRACYGRSLATGRPALIGEAVGIIAAQSIGEPGTQLTMRTFHTGGVAGKDITSGLPRVEELFEARSPKGKAKLAEISGEVLIFEGGRLIGTYDGNLDTSTTNPPHSMGHVIRVVNRVPFVDRHRLESDLRAAVEDGSTIAAGQVLAEPAPVTKARKAETKRGAEELDAINHPGPTPLLARTSGTIRLVDGGIEVHSEDVEVRDHHVDATDHRLVRTGDAIHAGRRLTAGVKDPHDILRIEGIEATQRYLLEEVQTVYRNQGVTISDKHIEIVVRQILRWVRVESIGDTDLLPNQLLDRLQFQEVNARTLAAGGDPATGKPELLGVTRASLNTDSFLAKASFQETTRVLTEAAIMGEVDYLQGLKENVIIGRLIPARLDISEEGRDILGLPEPLTPINTGDNGQSVDSEIASLLELPVTAETRLSLDDLQGDEEDDDEPILPDYEDDDDSSDADAPEADDGLAAELTDPSEPPLDDALAELSERGPEVLPSGD